MRHIRAKRTNDYAVCMLLLLMLEVTACDSIPDPKQYDCSGQSHLAQSLPVTQPLTNLFPLQDGMRWTFQNPSTGDYTWFDFSAMQGRFGCSLHYDSFLMMHITKSAKRAYWNPDYDAELFQPEAHTNNEIWSPGFYFRRGAEWMTFDLQGVNTLPYPYLPDVYSAPRSLSAPYRLLIGAGTSLECLPAHGHPPLVPWTTYWYVREVSTPAYGGAAVASHQCEGEHSDFEEVWLFAPGLGLVEIDALRQYGVPRNPPLVIKRQE
jgi:hypothetical protein